VYRGYLRSSPNPFSLRRLSQLPGAVKVGSGDLRKGRFAYWEAKMTIKPAVKISDRNLSVKGRSILLDVPENVLLSSASASGPAEGVFVGAFFNDSCSRQLVPLGTLREVRFLSCFRFKLWWMAQKMGTCGGDVPQETQFMLVETAQSEDSNEPIYAVFLPLLEGPFRASLQGNERDELALCIESGDPAVKTPSSLTHTLFVTAGSDPFATIADAFRAVKQHLKTFHLRTEKKVPGIVDWFGWCTWDAFYQDVTAEGVAAGLESLSSGETPPKFLIIDDGWQSVGVDRPQEEAKQLQRLTGIRANHKFQNDVQGIEHIVQVAKKKHGLKYVYVWHAITGYWGGVKPGIKDMEHYGSAMQYPAISPGVVNNEPWLQTDIITTQGLGLVNPKNVYQFYNELHSYLAEAGIDGVKVDAQCILETLGVGLGGRVQLTRQYHQALDASVARNFPDNGCIACMSHNTDALYCSKQTAVVRASDDFFPRDAVSHTIHIAAVAYNSVFLGEIMLPDWDMFHSLHPAGEYHAAARAISGGPVYVSDSPGKHNFDLLRKIVLPDGSILRARLPGRPTQDCLFADPARDGVSLLKIWNMNKFTGVLGVFNCQGAAWSSVDKKNVFHETQTKTLTASVRPGDIHLLPEAAHDDWNGDCIVYSHKGELIRLPKSASLPVSLQVLEHETYTVTPIKALGGGFAFAPLGLIDMINAGGAIESLTYEINSRVELEADFGAVEGEMRGLSLENKGNEPIATVKLQVKGCGRFGAYSPSKPRSCSVGSEEVGFSYDSATGLLTLNLEMPKTGRFHDVVIQI
ncbi:hypothetical protein AMTR_s00046p00128780, partial [Amborella trichopoda]